MALLDISQSRWLDLASGDTLTSAIWNGVKDDLISAINGGLDQDNFSSAALLAAVGDGVFATLDDPSAGASTQTISRNTTFNGTVLQDGTYKKTVTVDATTDTTVDVTDISAIILRNDVVNANRAITAFTNGVAGQIIDVTLACNTGAGTTYYIQLTDSSYSPTAGQFVLNGGNIQSKRGTDNAKAFRLQCVTMTDVDPGHASGAVLVWIQISAETTL